MRKWIPPQTRASKISLSVWEKRSNRVGGVLRHARSVKIRGTIDGHPFRSSFMTMGDGTHKLSVKADVRRVIGREAGDTVTVRLEARLSE